jgi:hypothetical protein
MGQKGLLARTLVRMAEQRRRAERYDPLLGLARLIRTPPDPARALITLQRLSPLDDDAKVGP